MNKELEEAIKVLNSYINAIDTFGTIDYKCINNLYKPVKTILKALDNSISKEVIEKKIEELDKKEKEELKGTKGQDRYFIKQMYNYQRKILQELLEGK